MTTGRINQIAIVLSLTSATSRAATRAAFTPHTHKHRRPGDSTLVRRADRRPAALFFLLLSFASHHRRRCADEDDGLRLLGSTTQFSDCRPTALRESGASSRPVERLTGGTLSTSRIPSTTGHSLRTHRRAVGPRTTEAPVPGSWCFSLAETTHGRRGHYLPLLL